MCSCTSHRWLARPITPHPGDQAIAGECTDRADAYGAGLAAALALYDRRTQLGDHSSLLIEVAVDTDIAAWLPVTPTDGHQPDRDRFAASLSTVHGRLLGTDWPTPLPQLPGSAVRVDLDPAPPAPAGAEAVPGHPGRTPWS